MLDPVRTDPDSRTLSAALYLPAGLSRPQRKAAARQVRRLQSQARNARLEADRQARQAASDDNRTDKTIAPGGERRPHALRTYRSLKVNPTGPPATT